ncbi:MAG: hypothetical protein J5367_01385 [Lachnospiraceae bacterium]|nr:hypothetical protein [Lachnospiraceae bacterium]
MDKKTGIINFIKGLIIAATAAGILFMLSKILVLKSEDGINQFDAFYKQPENSIDVLFVGSSKVYCDIATGVLWENHGIASFDLGGAEAPAWVSYYQLKEALKTQRPKVICYEASVAAMYPSILCQSDEWASDNSYGMKWNSNRTEQLRANSETEESYRTRLNPFNVMHGRYNDLNENDFTNIRNTARYKGFDPRSKIVEMETPDISGVTDTEPVSEKAEEYIRKIIQLAKSEDIPIILFASPCDAVEEEQQIINSIWQIADSEGVEHIDFNLKYDEFDMDYSKDMSVGNHLGYTGNYKFSDYFGKILKEKYDIPDRRGDSRYVSWDWDATYQNYERQDLLISRSENAAEVMNLASQGYIIFGINEDKGVIIENGEPVAGDPDQSEIRLVYKSGDNAFLMKDWYNKNDHMVSLFINDKEYTEFYGNILFIYDNVNHQYVRSIYF